MIHRLDEMFDPNKVNAGDSIVQDCYGVDQSFRVKTVHKHLDKHGLVFTLSAVLGPSGMSSDMFAYDRMRRE